MKAWIKAPNKQCHSCLVSNDLKWVFFFFFKTDQKFRSGSCSVQIRSFFLPVQIRANYPGALALRMQGFVKTIYIRFGFSKKFTWIFINSPQTQPITSHFSASHLGQSPQGSASGYKPQPGTEHDSVCYLTAADALINITDDSVGSGSVALLQHWVVMA